MAILSRSQDNPRVMLTVPWAFNAYVLVFAALRAKFIWGTRAVARGKDEIGGKRT